MIQICDYDTHWPEEFAAEAERLRAALGSAPLRIDHVGSTSVPGLAAKPVIDIQISVNDSTAIRACQGPLESLGYTHATVPFAYYHRPEAWPHTHHVHVREVDSTEALRLLAFRDWLRSHPEDCRSYEALKRRVAAVADPGTADGRVQYSEAKTRFIREIEQRAREESP